MIACCSPAESFLEETLSTLNYATRAKNIQNRPMIQMDPKEQLIFNLRQEAKVKTFLLCSHSNITISTGKKK
jgi:hypothetical protein